VDVTLRFSLGDSTELLASRVAAVAASVGVKVSSEGAVLAAASIVERYVQQAGGFGAPLR
jgi:hypothetical protein